MLNGEMYNPSKGGKRMESQTHLLKQLKLPSRYESLVNAVGSDVARLLVEPNPNTLDIFRRAALHIQMRGRGLFLPLFAISGTGKTTLVSNLSAWIPEEYGSTARLTGGEVSADRLRQAVKSLLKKNDFSENGKKILVVNVDDRESDPPTNKELAQIKSFVREEGLGSRTLVVWPETSLDNAREMSKEYEKLAGPSPVDIPAHVDGPERQTWGGVASATLKLVNSIDRLEELGINLDLYEEDKFRTVGDFLEKISYDFVDLLDKLLNSTRKPVRLVVVFASVSGKAGVLSELSSGYRYGLLDASKLVAATPNSVIGKWWSDRLGLLVQTIVRLDARVTFVGPSLSVPIINRYGPDMAKDALKELGITRKPPSEISAYFERSDLGRLLLGTAVAASEIRGNPATTVTQTFVQLSQKVGFGSGQDKKLNFAFGEFIKESQSPLGEVMVEKKAMGPH
ncbi:hypothetical protein MHT86_02625 [Corynebacterium mastitidis]|uniref:hypothetical protein n=1 Tax=Corynebacterium mastitidis TaxID=161890 RepID=UPI0012FF2415|nr:hypothetical protein [Corynebacterium mastitidis]MCH6196395.1 hypothetical protein [Corynebacterium mastitidis]